LSSLRYVEAFVLAFVVDILAGILVISITLCVVALESVTEQVNPGFVFRKFVNIINIDVQSFVINVVVVQGKDRRRRWRNCWDESMEGLWLARTDLRLEGGGAEELGISSTSRDLFRPRTAALPRLAADILGLSGELYRLGASIRS